ncbi:MAG TPA: hypothetical protein VJL07_02625 [Dehalococcoidia bacterium]|nr:hypothetical protein [Dehalococcoidia bacterium]
MKVRIIGGQVDANFPFKPGEDADVSESTALDWIRCGVAEAVQPVTATVLAEEVEDPGPEREADEATGEKAVFGPETDKMMRPSASTRKSRWRE